jgi:hypothetical protein
VARAVLAMRPTERVTTNAGSTGGFGCATAIDPFEDLSTAAVIPKRRPSGRRDVSCVDFKGREPARCRLKFNEAASYGVSAPRDDAVDMKFTAS